VRAMAATIRRAWTGQQKPSMHRLARMLVVILAMALQLVSERLGVGF